MAKLTKTELEALSYEIRNDIIKAKKDSIKEQEDSLIEDFYQTELGLKIKFVNEHPDMKDLQKINMFIIKKLAKVPIHVYPSSEEIKRKLIIGQIDSTNVENLIKEVKESFL